MAQATRPNPIMISSSPLTSTENSPVRRFQRMDMDETEPEVILTDGLDPEVDEAAMALDGTDIAPRTGLQQTDDTEPLANPDDASDWYPSDEDDDLPSSGEFRLARPTHSGLSWTTLPLYRAIAEELLYHRLHRAQSIHQLVNDPAALNATAELSKRVYSARMAVRAMKGIPARKWKIRGSGKDPYPWWLATMFRFNRDEEYFVNKGPVILNFNESSLVGTFVFGTKSQAMHVTLHEHTILFVEEVKSRSITLHAAGFGIRLTTKQEKVDLPIRRALDALTSNIIPRTARETAMIEQVDPRQKVSAIFSSVTPAPEEVPSILHLRFLDSEDCSSFKEYLRSIVRVLTSKNQAQRAERYSNPQKVHEIGHTGAAPQFIVSPYHGHPEFIHKLVVSGFVFTPCVMTFGDAARRRIPIQYMTFADGVQGGGHAPPETPVLVHFSTCSKCGVKTVFMSIQDDVEARHRELLGQNGYCPFAVEV
ncbi:hypothetical protein BJ742DRAFT_190289 [Cladochytrium replicatum]|nr:hypothetical protein BJ742DRAFT_190289 [Cladochytrium replicatum]